MRVARPAMRGGVGDGAVSNQLEELTMQSRLRGDILVGSFG